MPGIQMAIVAVWNGDATRGTIKGEAAATQTAMKMQGSVEFTEQEQPPSSVAANQN